MKEKINPVLSVITLVLFVASCVIIFILGFADAGFDSWDEGYSLIPKLTSSDTTVYDTGNLVVDEPEVYTLTIPDGLNSASLCMKVKHLLITIESDGEILFSANRIERPLYTNSIGSYFIILPVSHLEPGTELQISCLPCYSQTSGLVDNIRLEDSWSYVKTVILSKLSFLFVCLFLGFCSISCMCLHIPLKSQFNDFLYLGLMSLCIAVYTFCESQILQLFCVNSQLVHLITYFSLSFVPVTLVFYTQEFYNVKNRKVSYILIFYSLFTFLINSILNFYSPLDYHMLAFLPHSAILFSISYTIFCLFNYIKALRAQSQLVGPNKISFILQTCGFMGMCVCTLIDIFRFYFLKSSDMLVFVKLSVVVFVVTYMVASVVKLFSVMKTVNQSSFISKLAYSDGLTGLKNRTAFNERISNTDENYGIVMFDVNNLKYVNDNFGHGAGDSLLLAAADTLKELFEPLMVSSEIYRIGGDEFVVVLLSEDFTEFNNCCDWVSSNLPIVSEKHSDAENNLNVSIAYGFGFYACANKLTKPLADVLSEADSNMYQCKRLMKARALTEVEGEGVVV